MKIYTLFVILLLSSCCCMGNDPSPVLGYKPLDIASIDFTAPNGKTTVVAKDVNDAYLLKGLQRIVDTMKGTAYYDQFQQYLEQVYLPPHDPNRYFYIQMMSPEEYDFHSEGKDTICMTVGRGDEGPTDIMLTISSRVLLGWETDDAQDPDLPKIAGTVLVHEMKHMQEYFDAPDLVVAVDYVNQLQDKGAKGTVTPDQLTRVRTQQVSSLLMELRADAQECKYIHSHCSELVPRLERQDPSFKSIYNAWLANDMDRFADLIYSQNAKTIFAAAGPAAGSEHGIKMKIIRSALKNPKYLPVLYRP